MQDLRIQLFGRFQVRYRGEVLAGFDARKVQELFCYLLLYRDRPHTREFLASLLWGDDSDTRARTYLRKALWQLQAALSRKAESFQPQVLQIDTEWVRVSSGSPFWLDVEVFEQTFGLVKAVHGEDLDGERAKTLEEALSLYKGAVLEGWYQDWCLCERERFQSMYLSMMDKLMDWLGICQAYECAIDYGMRILRYDRAHERTHQKLMRLYYLAGDRTSALREYEHCATALSEELGVEPAQRTKTLYQQVLSGRLESADPSSAAADGTSCQLQTFLEHLKELQVAVSDLETKVQREISALENALRNGAH